MLKKNEAISRLNKLGAEGQSFSFYCDFFGEQWFIQATDSDNQSLAFQLEIGGELLGVGGQESEEVRSQKLGVRGQELEVRSQELGVRSWELGAESQKLEFEKYPISFEIFEKAFNKVVGEINIGNSFLTNLTFETPIETNLSLKEIFVRSKAKYKLLVPDQFVVFSPETFVKIKDDYIYSYPMKGTIDANIPNAESTILNDIKEKAEHVTIVDLIRNDLSQVAEKVEVTKFRYIDELVTNDKRLLQVSSEVKGTLPKNWKEHLGTILSKLLPAGSISGAPKPETLKIIEKVESYERGFYTGICGHFDGQSLNTGVMIRFIKKKNDQLIYCSGGGITSFSEPEKEYKEMTDKVYLAF